MGEARQDHQDFDRKLAVLKQRVDRLYQQVRADPEPQTQEPPERCEVMPYRSDHGQHGATSTRWSQQDLPPSDPSWLEHLLRHLPAGVAWLNHDHTLILANAAARRYVAILSTATMGERVTLLGDQPIERLVTPRRDDLPHEVVLTDPPRRVFTIRTHTVPTGSTGGGWVLLIQEVTLERERQQQRAQLEQQVAVEQLIIGIANEFNNLLGVVTGYADLLQERPDLPQTVKDNLAIMARRGWRGSRLLRQLLDSCRQPPATLYPLDLLPILKEITARLRHTMPASIRVVLESAPEVYGLRADAMLIQKLLANLTANAREAMPNGGTLCFSLSRLNLCPGTPRPYAHMPDGEWVVLRISDSGIGMASPVSDRIFEAFFTTKGKGHTGLGLTQVGGIVKQHNGYRTVHSQLGKGTTFTLYFPSEMVPLGPVEDAVPEGVRGLGETLLLVDHDPIVRESLRLTLRYLQYRVLTARNARDGLAVYERHRNTIALVLMDLAPTESNGLALLQKLRQRNHNLQVIILVQEPLTTTYHDLLIQEGVAYVCKPSDLLTLAQAVRRALQ